MDKNYKNENGLSLIDWIRGMYDSMDEENKRDAELFFPELKENEDERIRKELIAFVKFALKDGNALSLCSKTTKEDVISWLEKQKIISDYLKTNGIVIRDDGSIEKHTIGYLTKPNEHKPSDLVTELKRHLETTPKEQLEKEWKELEPWGNIGPTIHEFLYGKHMSTEWSEEDKARINHLVAFVEKHGLEYYASIDKVVAWLKDLPNRFAIHPEQEWSEEKQQTISFAIDWLTRMLERTNVPEAKRDIESVILGLKSLRPQSHWKPSEEQMIYLKEAINKFYFCDAENAGLQALYEQLKSL